MFLAMLIIGLVALVALVLCIEYLAQHITGVVYALLVTATAFILIGTGGLAYERDQRMSYKCTEGYVYHDGICVQGYKP